MNKELETNQSVNATGVATLARENGTRGEDEEDEESGLNKELRLDTNQRVNATRVDTLARENGTLENGTHGEDEEEESAKNKELSFETNQRVNATGVATLARDNGTRGEDDEEEESAMNKELSLEANQRMNATGVAMLEGKNGTRLEDEDEEEEESAMNKELISLETNQRLNATGVATLARDNGTQLENGTRGEDEEEEESGLNRDLSLETDQRVNATGIATLARENRTLEKGTRGEDDEEEEEEELAMNKELSLETNQRVNATGIATLARENGTLENERRGEEEEESESALLPGVWTHPMDPHKPNFSALLPEVFRPYPSFEGWFIRILDPEKEFSAAVILATNYATGESQVTILFSLGKDRDGNSSSSSSGATQKRRGYTYAVAVKTKDAGFKRNGNSGEKRAVEQLQGFEWEATGIGRIVFTPHLTNIDFTVDGYNFKAQLTEELLWDARNSAKGPEGWARYVSVIPTHWYVYSLGSTVNYSFTNPEEEIRSEGAAFGHVEKNWGQSFPGGHVWLQAFSSDNTAQVCCAGAYFETAHEKLRSPYIFVLGYRSPKLQLDFRTNDLGILFKDTNFAPLESSFSVTAVGPSYTVEVKAHAPYDTFSPPVLAPVTKLDWKPACRESYLATVEIQVYEHLAWGMPGTQTLVETQKFEFAALEFGEDLLSEAPKHVENSKN